MKKMISVVMIALMILSSSAIAFASTGEQTSMKVVDDKALLDEMAIDLGLEQTEDQFFTVKYDTARMIYQVTITKKMSTAWYEPPLYCDVTANANDVSGGWEWVSVVSDYSYRGASVFVGQWSRTGFTSSISSNRKNISCTLKGTWAQVVGADGAVLGKYSATYNFNVSTTDI